MAEVDGKLPQELTLRASDEQAGIRNPTITLELQTKAHPGALNPQAT